MSNTEQYLHNAYATDAVSNGTDFYVRGRKIVALEVTSAVGTTSFSITFQVSVDGTNFTTLNMTDFSTGGDATTAAGAASYSAAFWAFVGAAKYVRAYVSALTHGTGSISVFGRAV